jgi:hypothetical protein
LLWAQWTLPYICTNFPFEEREREREREHVCVFVPEKATVFTRIGQAVVKLNIIAGSDLDQLLKSLPNSFQDHKSIYNPTIEQICYLYVIASEIKRKSERKSSWVFFAGDVVKSVQLQNHSSPMRIV